MAVSPAAPVLRLLALPAGSRGGPPCAQSRERCHDAPLTLLLTLLVPLAPASSDVAAARRPLTACSKRHAEEVDAPSMAMMMGTGLPLLPGGDGSSCWELLTRVDGAARLLTQRVRRGRRPSPRDFRVACQHAC